MPAQVTAEGLDPDFASNLTSFLHKAGGQVTSAVVGGVNRLSATFGGSGNAAAPESMEAKGDNAGADTNDTFVARVIKISNAEWALFGSQQYNVSGSAIKVGHKEQESGYYTRIGEYWREGTGTNGVDGRDADMPWSAAFISWVMRSAGAGDRFRYSTMHSIYIFQAIRDRLRLNKSASFWGWRLNECKPALGDLVCWAREAGVDYDNQKNGNYKGHTDIIVEIEDDKVWVIGGNVGNSVTKRPLLRDDRGFLKPSNAGGETLFALVQCRIGMEDVPDPTPGPRTNQEAFASTGPLPDGGDVIAWGAAISKALKARIVEVATEIGCDPSHLSSAIAFESAETFSPSIQNPRSKATGLIQFMPKTAISLGTTIEDLAAMSAVEQMAYVEKYFKPHKGKLNGLSDVYMAILWPSAVGRQDSQPLFMQGTVQYDQNKGLDTNHDGVVTKGEAASLVQAKLERGLAQGRIG